MAPRQDLVLQEDPTRRSLWWTVGYILRIRTNLVLIASSALGYYFLTGIESFGLLFIITRYGVAKSTASALVPLWGWGHSRACTWAGVCPTGYSTGG